MRKQQQQASTLPVITLHPYHTTCSSLNPLESYKRVWTYPVTLVVHYETIQILKSKRTHERDEIGF